MREGDEYVARHTTARVCLPPRGKGISVLEAEHT